MEVSGREIADHLLTELSGQVNNLKQKNITPTLVVIQVGDDPGSTSYIRQKAKAAEKTGINLIHEHRPETTKVAELTALINKYNRDPGIHALIVQRPVPEALNRPEILNLVSQDKDVDGFLPDSKFVTPVALAVGKILFEIYHLSYNSDSEISDSFDKYIRWLTSKHICIIGRGETAGKPITEFFQSANFRQPENYFFNEVGESHQKHNQNGVQTQRVQIGSFDDDVNQRRRNDPEIFGGSVKRPNNLQCAMSIIHSHTPKPVPIMKQADIIISCVGKLHVIQPQSIKPGVILISVGITRGEDNKLHGDYESNEISGLASFYTPTPGGVGPVNVASLMANTLKAANFS